MLVEIYKNNLAGELAEITKIHIPNKPWVEHIANIHTSDGTKLLLVRSYTSHDEIFLVGDRFRQFDLDNNLLPIYQADEVRAELPAGAKATSRVESNDGSYTFFFKSQKILNDE